MSVSFGRSLFVFAFACSAMFASLASADDHTIGYRRDVLPIVSDRCFKCHGPDSATRKAGLRLDQSDAAKAALDSGATAIVPGKPDDSELVKRIMSKDADEMMPPPDSGKVLSDAERAVLRRWNEQGGKYEKALGVVAPERPPVPEVKRPDVVQNPIDNFIIAKLEAEKPEPAPRASKERLIRRLYFDFVGLPPSLAE